MLVRLYKIGQGFSASQRWRSITTADGAFPYCKLQRRQIEDIRDLWQAISNMDGAAGMFINMHCIETNILEGTFQFDLSVSLALLMLLSIAIRLTVITDAEKPDTARIR